MKNSRQNNGKIDKLKALRSKVENTIKARQNYKYEQKFSICIGDSKQVYKLLNESLRALLSKVLNSNSKVLYLMEDGCRIDYKLCCWMLQTSSTLFCNYGTKTK